MTTLDILKKTRAAWPHISSASNETKNALLLAMAHSLERESAAILAANREDMDAARGRISDVMLDRLYLDEKRIGRRHPGYYGAARPHGTDPVGGAPSQRHDHL